MWLIVDRRHPGNLAPASSTSPTAAATAGGSRTTPPTAPRCDLSATAGPGGRRVARAAAIDLLAPRIHTLERIMLRPATGWPLLRATRRALRGLAAARTLATCCRSLGAIAACRTLDSGAIAPLPTATSARPLRPICACGTLNTVATSPLTAITGSRTLHAIAAARTLPGSRGPLCA